ncbi:hypothetical protein [Bacillus sp. FJAT-42315]|uniref:hypothetical protein n=1 Tax=Bacillus sp. FJAT-42315 TaxID=2014077 RepID=UPI000C23B81E|nr:hypothetical protein [Bacillus sp. FJAT-42315]
MAKAKTSSYILEFELIVQSARNKVILDKKMRIGKSIYNACLGYCLKRLKAVKADKEYRTLLKEPSSKVRNQRLREIERSHGYSEYQVHEFAKSPKYHFGKALGINEVQKLATRAFQSVEKVHYHQAARVHFKKKFDDMSIENKSNNTGLRKKDMKILWGELELDFKVKRNDDYALEGLCDRTKYVRVIKREIRGKQRYFVQLVQEGLPPKKYNCEPKNDDSKRVGMDVGTSTSAIVSEENVMLVELAPDCTPDYKELRKVQRAMDRSKRASNPDNFDKNGVAKKGRRTWTYSNRYIQLKAKRKELYRKLTVKRKQSHEQLANEILALGSDIRVETMQFQSLAKRAKNTTRNKKNGKINKKKRYGKTIAHRAPAMLISIIDRKLRYQGRSIKKIDTYSTKASQFNHATQTYAKKQLNERWNDIQGLAIQRDLYSAFLIGNTHDNLDSVDVDLCNDQWKKFVALHHLEIERLRQSSNKTLSWYVA